VINAATDNLGVLDNAASQPESCAIQQPINTDGSSVLSGSKGVIPVKFKLSFNGVSTCQLPAATISLVHRH
jgi:hypothetical protein